MQADRLEVRLDPERRAKLAQLASTRGMSVSTLVRAWIDEQYRALDWERRRHAVNRIAQCAVEDVPDPETLSRQLAETHAGPDLY